MVYPYDYGTFSVTRQGVIIDPIENRVSIPAIHEMFFK